MSVLTAREIHKVFLMEPPRSDTFSKLVKFVSGSMPKRAFHALKDISFDLAQGRAMALCGPNGSGKTTLLKILAGILPPTSGVIYRKGKTTCLIGFSSILQERLSVEDNARLCAVFFEVAGPVEKTAAHLIAESGLKEFRNARLEELSAGMRIRLPFMAALDSGADLFIIDEALAVGDAEFQAKCIQKIKDLKAAGAAIVFATHAMKMVEKLAEDVLLLDAGRQIYKGPVADMPQPPVGLR